MSKHDFSVQMASSLHGLSIFGFKTELSPEGGGGGGIRHDGKEAEMGKKR